ncbi:hypothetical protein [Secundilactobacillus paracollinoides]|uniref:Uncharacterized protein n=1 Tax=Secundilactobacillus paracollinoides TaxID=240427 RepID=A0A1B2J1Q1_9LACO|nr:hypothetical protein [Secundilactobacillus paracollinoides]ANZ62230.1 hypothetical protein AYR61_13335 [Secundilactobacillus paracollinoides]ANZ68178.1 hypothetical protein AYR63_14210 [Secundilactobacillus paracollinoides]
MNRNKIIDFSDYDRAEQAIISQLQAWQRCVDQVEIAVRDTQQFTLAIQVNNQIRSEIQILYQQNQRVNGLLPAANRRLQRRFLVVLMTLVNQLRSVPSHAEVYTDLVAFKDRVMDGRIYIKTGHRG